jgi:hypothetical protein
LHKRLSILAGFVALLCAGLPANVYAQGSAQAFESKLEGWRRNFNVWLHQRSPEQPFRYYGFFEATEKYLRTRILGQEPEDVARTSGSGPSGRSRAWRRRSRAPRSKSRNASNTSRR